MNHGHMAEKRNGEAQNIKEIDVLIFRPVISEKWTLQYKAK